MPYRWGVKIVWSHSLCDFLVGVWIGFMVPSLWWLRLNHAYTPGPPNSGVILKHQTSLIYLNPSCGKKSDLWQHKRSMFPFKSCCLGLLQLPVRPVAYGSVRAQCVPLVQFDPFMPFQFIAGKKSDLHRWMLKLLSCKRQERKSNKYILSSGLFNFLTIPFWFLFLSWIHFFPCSCCSVQVQATLVFSSILYLCDRKKIDCTLN